MPAQPKRVKISQQSVTGDHSDSARRLVEMKKHPPTEYEPPKGTKSQIAPSIK